MRIEELAYKDKRKYILYAILIVVCIVALSFWCYSIHFMRGDVTDEHIYADSDIVSVGKDDFYSKNRYMPPDNWWNYCFRGIFSISIPPTMELRKNIDKYTEELRKSGNENLPSMDRIIFQQKKLSSIDDKALKTYSRIIINIQRGKSGDFMKSSEHEELSIDEMRYFQEQAKINAGTFTVIGVPNVCWVNIDGIYGIEVEYTRTGMDKAGTHVYMYYFFNDDKMAILTLSYRVKDAAQWEADFSRVVRTFKWNHPSPTADSSSSIQT